MDSERTLEQLAADYVAGNLLAEEADEFEQLLTENSELRAEVEQLEQVVGLMLDELPLLEPPSHLREQVLAELPGPEVEAAVQPQMQAQAQPQVQSQAQPQVQSQPQPTFQRQPQRSTVTWLLAAVAAGTSLLALALGVNNNRLRLANQQLQQELLIAQPAQQAQLILQQPATRFYDFAGTEQATDAFGSMIVDTDGLQAAIAFKNLTPVSAAQTYALWVRHQGEYIPCGEFQTNPDGTVFVTLDMPAVYQSRPWVKEVIVTVESADLPAQPTGPIVAQTI